MFCILPQTTSGIIEAIETNICSVERLVSLPSLLQSYQRHYVVQKYRPVTNNLTRKTVLPFETVQLE